MEQQGQVEASHGCGDQHIGGQAGGFGLEWSGGQAGLARALQQQLHEQGSHQGEGKQGHGLHHLLHPIANAGRHRQQHLLHAEGKEHRQATAAEVGGQALGPVPPRATAGWSWAGSAIAASCGANPVELAGQDYQDGSEHHGAHQAHRGHGQAEIPAASKSEAGVDRPHHRS